MALDNSGQEKTGWKKDSPHLASKTYQIIRTNNELHGPKMNSEAEVGSLL